MLSNNQWGLFFKQEPMTKVFIKSNWLTSLLYVLISLETTHQHFGGNGDMGK